MKEAKQSIRLNDHDSLLLNRGAKDWTQLYLQRGNDVISLGADSYSIIVQRIKSGFVEYEKREKLVVHGLPAIWLLSLFERHFRLFLSSESGTQTMLFIEGEGKLAATVSIDPILNAVTLLD